MRRLALHLSFLLLLSSFTQAAPLSGTKSIGPTGDYPSITAAISDVITQTLGGALVLELQPTYLSTVETFPLIFSNLSTTAVNTLTLRPQSGATNLLITSADTTTATVDLNGAQFLTIDGRPGGVGSNAASGGGSVSQLTIANTSTSLLSVTLRFINGAKGNTIQYATLKGSTPNGGKLNGTVLFSTTTEANGNNENTIDHCDIRDGASFPANGLYSLGSTETKARFNSGNIISNSNIFNFYSSGHAVGVRLDEGNTDWTITGNSFYQTAPRTSIVTSTTAIRIVTHGANFVITGNSIGGDSPGAAVTNQKWTSTIDNMVSGASFFGIYLVTVDTNRPSTLQGNTIANIAWTGGPWTGIYVAGSADIGTVTGNVIGSGAGTNSVTILGSNPSTSGIIAVERGTRNIINNVIGAITVSGPDASYSTKLTGINVTGGANTISNNLVGSAITANSLNVATSSTSLIAQRVTGILSSSSDRTIIINNTVANLNNNSAQTEPGSGQIQGIVTSAGVNTIIGNTVRNLSTKGKNPNGTNAQSVYGIFNSMAAVGGQVISQNTVHSLANTAATGAVGVTGIYLFVDSFGTCTIARNLVHSLVVSSSSTSSQLKGMELVGGTFTAQNNMVRIGLDANGNSTAGASILRGIFDNSSQAGRSFYHNSVYLGGIQTSGVGTTRAFDGSAGVSNVRTIQNNIFVNARSNNGSTGKHYAVTYGGTNRNPAGLTAGGNLFLAGGTGGVLGLFFGVDRISLSSWQDATGQDIFSAVADPRFVNPTGDAGNVDLHLLSDNPAESGGITLTGRVMDPLTMLPAVVNDDFDGQPRSTLNPVDIGADAGNFTASPDLYAPLINYPLLTNGSSSSRQLTGWVSITDGVLVSDGTNAPRLYYKRSTDRDDFNVVNSAAGNGWKYVIATGSGPYSFTMDYSIINGGSVSAGDTIQYFVVAQDTADHLGSSPAMAVASAHPPVQNISAKPSAGVNSFSIVGGTIGGMVTVGGGGTYSSLSGPGGLFSALNGAVLTSNLIVSIISDLSETGGVTLNPFNSAGFPFNNYTLTIQPDSATMRTISGNTSSTLITLNGSDRVTIDGNSGGSGRNFTFRNTSTALSSKTLLFLNDACNNTVRNCIVEGAGGSVISFSTGSETGNDNNLISNCQVRDLSSG